MTCNGSTIWKWFTFKLNYVVDANHLWFVMYINTFVIYINSSFHCNKLEISNKTSAGKI